jgi:nucleotide-binding universal stress UspA family protein
MTMYKRILIATDGSDLAGKALTHGLALAKALNAPVVVTTVTEGWNAFEIAHMARLGNRDPINQFEEMVSSAASNVLGHAAEVAKAQGVTFETVHVRDSHPAEGIIATAKEKGCDLIVMASHGRRGVDRLLLGSQASEVLTHSKVPALIVR